MNFETKLIVMERVYNQLVEGLQIHNRHMESLRSVKVEVISYKFIRFPQRIGWYGYTEFDRTSSWLYEKKFVDLIEKFSNKNLNQDNLNRLGDLLNEPQKVWYSGYINDIDVSEEDAQEIAETITGRTLQEARYFMNSRHVGDVLSESFLGHDGEKYQVSVENILSGLGVEGKNKCTCPREIWMYQGCKCGGG